MRKLIPLPPRKPEGEVRSILQDKQAFANEFKTDILARTIWGEARGERSAGMQAVACVVMNRVRLARKMGGYWWGNTVDQVCQKPYQFSCWNKDDPNYKQLMAVDRKDLIFATALRIARRGIRDQLDDPTGAATHYHAAGVSPYWAVNKQPTSVIGRHIFYKLLEVS